MLMLSSDRLFYSMLINVIIWDENICVVFFTTSSMLRACRSRSQTVLIDKLECQDKVSCHIEGTLAARLCIVGVNGVTL
jgi:hypothetical protein